MSDGVSGASTACLLLHGFGGTPFEMEPLAPPLRERGCTVELPLYPGHGSTVEEFRSSFFLDWLGLAEERFLTLTAHHARVIPIGFSMGGSIALMLAAKHWHLPQLAGVAALSPAYAVFHRRLFFRRLGTSLRGLRKKLLPLKPEQLFAQSESRRIAPYEGYENVTCLPQVLSLHTGLRTMRALLPGLSCPLFLMAEVHDMVCPPEAGLNIARAVASTDINVCWVRMRERATSHHMLTTHRDTRDAVASAVAGFVERMMRGA